MKLGTSFVQKWNFCSKMEKVDINIEFCIFELVKVPNFSLNWKFWGFGLNLPNKGISCLKQKKWTPPLSSAYSNLPMNQISFKKILNFGTKFAQKGYFLSKTEKVNIAIEFCIFELVYVQNFSLKLVSAIFLKLTIHLV